MKKLFNKEIDNFIIIISSILYSVILSSVPIHLFDDRDNYLLYAGQSLSILNENFETSYLKFLSNEPLWLAFNSVLAVFLSETSVVKAIIFIASLIFAITFLKLSGRNYLIAIPLLFLPNILVNFTVHLRQGFGEALFLSGFLLKNKYIKSIVWIITVHIHSSFLYLMGILGIESQINRNKYSIFKLILMAFFISLILIYSTEIVASLVGARQVGEEKDWEKSGTGIGFIFFIFVLIIFIINGDNFIYKNYYALILLIFYLSGYFNFYWAARIFESSLPIVLLAGLNLKGNYKTLFITIISLYGFYGLYEIIGKLI